MADYNVSEVLNAIFDDEDAAWKPSDKIPLVVKEIELLKNELKIFICNSDYDIQNIIEESQELSSESKLLVSHLEKCKKEIEDETMAEIVKSIENYNSLSRELECVDYAARLVGDVIQCGRFLKEVEEGKKVKSFSRSVEAACDLVEYLDLASSRFEYLDIAAKTKEKADLALEGLIQDLCSEWNKMLHWEVKTSARKTIVNIYIMFQETYFCYDILNALEVCKKLPEKISEFAKFLFDDVIKYIMYNESVVFPESEDCLNVTFTHKPDYKPPYESVIANYRALFDFLSRKLSISYKGSPDKILTVMLGKQMSDKLADTLINDCFIDTIPNNIIDLQAYGKVTNDIENFQQFLVSIRFFPSDNSISILKYVDNIDVLFADKSSKHLLEHARAIMLKDLSAAMSIGVESIPPDGNKSSTNDDTQEALDILDKTIPNSLFYFPRCMISKSAQELLDLMYMIMEQAAQCPGIVCKKLYNTSRLILELYDAVVPYHHENYLQTIPQYVALFHNNCMYLAHNMQTLGDKWRTHLEGREVQYPISFVDLVQKLRDLGYRHLTIHMQQQRKQILDNIRSSDLNCIVTKDVLGDNAEAAVRQCLRQLQLLKNVWIGVFPANVFTRLMATLVHLLVEELAHRACSAEDLSVEMAAQLADMLALVGERAPPLFQAARTAGAQDGKQFRHEKIWSSEDMQAHVASWTKLQELIFVLRGSLKDIESHWSDGTGPLAVHFRTEELRNLIKALFQNTQHRANLLSKIK